MSVAPTPSPEAILEEAKKAYEDSDVSLASLVPVRFQDNKEFMDSLKGIMISDWDNITGSLQDYQSTGSAKLVASIFTRGTVYPYLTQRESLRQQYRSAEACVSQLNAIAKKFSASPA
ncbi:hypothetical protein EBX31_04815 [bacterium]|nr:hypothetical protein [bacterium]